MTRTGKRLRISLLALLGILVLVLLVFFLYFNSLWGVDATVRDYYRELELELERQDYAAATMVICGKRHGWVNWIGRGAKNSQHVQGKAIDILVFDVNRDGSSDERDVNIVYKILDEKIVQDNGGVGTYKKQSGFWNRRQVHFDSRGHRKRWHL